jgi:hypothetical protein
VRELVLHRCTCVVRALVLHLYMYVAHESVVRHHDGHVVRVLVHRRCTCAERELAHHRDERDLLVRHRDVRVVRVLAHRRCTCAERELDVHLHSDHEFRLAFRHLCVVACRKDSKHRYYA